MGFEKETRNALAKMVTGCRRVLTTDVTDQLRGIYGLHPDGASLDLNQLTHLTEDQVASARSLRDLLEHYCSVLTGPSMERVRSAYDRLVLEIGFTILNRLAALRLCEERGLVIECVRKGMTSDGFRVFESISGGALGTRYETYRVFIESLFDELSIDLGILFDRTTPQSAIFPSEGCLEEVFALLDNKDLIGIWKEDETIGWIYQYFNPPEERRAMRDASQAPRNSRELAVRNQFFTPRYVVEFLTDNTLGRIWYEMRQGQTALKDECRYLVRRPDEVFLCEEISTQIQAAVKWLRAETEDEPDMCSLAHTVNGYMRAGAAGEESNKWVEDRLPRLDSQEAASQLNTQDLLDLLFLFCRKERFCEGTLDALAPQINNILNVIRERVEATRKPDRTQEELLKAPVFVPFRKKKDPRDIKILDPACGSGHFLLYAFDLLETIYKEAWDDPDSPVLEATGKTLKEDFSSFEELRSEIPDLILRWNLHGIDIDPRAVQIAALALWLRAQRSWQAQGLKAAERPRITKSNIVCAEPMPGETDMLREFTAGLEPKVLGQLVEVIFEKMKLAGEAGSLLKIEEEIQGAIKEAKKQWTERPRHEQIGLLPEAQKRPVQKALFDVREIKDEVFWEEAEDHILHALKAYAEKAGNGHALRRRLFAEDAAHGFAFIDLCRKRFDVVLMNPPFGEPSVSLLDYAARVYPTWNKNTLCAFIERGWQFSKIFGAIAGIYDRTAIVKSTYEEFRNVVLISDNRLNAMADLGWGVLDANVEVTTSILHHQPSINKGIFIDSREIEIDRKGTHIRDSVLSFNNGISQEYTFYKDSSLFQHLPNSVIGYDFPNFLIEAFGEFASLEKSYFKASQGHALKAEKHFRLWWEIPIPTKIGFVSRMFNGSGFAPYLTSLYDCIIAQVTPESLPKDTATVIRNRDVQLLPGICFGKRGEFFCVQILPQGHIFTVEGQAIPVKEKDRAFEALGLLNTPLIRFSLNKYCGQHKYSGYVNLLPYHRLSNMEKCKNYIVSAIDAVRNAQCFDEIQSFFSIIPLKKDIDSSTILVSHSIDYARKVCREAETCCHEESLRTYRVSEKERREIDSFQMRQPQIESPIRDADISSGCKWFLAHSVISTILGTLFGRWDIRIAKDPSLAPKLPDPFDSLPVCPPSMLQGPDGLPAKPGGIVSEEWLRARPDANTLPPEGAVKRPTITDDEYPLRISWDGIMVDDPGFNGSQPHRADIVRRAREVLDLLWGEKAQSIEQEACEILGVADLRDYFRRPSGFFQDHLKRYSKSRRKAPIYWPLSTASGSYTVWLYYHRMDDQILYAVVNNYVGPKIAEVERGLSRIDEELAAATGKEATHLRDRLNEGRAFLGELRDFREELLRIAALPYKPDLNDGVIINAAPFHGLFRLRSWAKDTEDCWKRLEKGEYDWAHMAYVLWTDRVKGVCKKDRSIAIAHGLEDLCEVKQTETKGRKRRKMEEEEEE